MPYDRISCNPKVMMGKPVINSTRITVEFILRMLGAGHPIEELLAEYDLTREDIEAAQSFAAEYLAHDRIDATGLMHALLGRRVLVPDTCRNVEA